MQRLAATALLALFSWMLALSAFALPAGSTLPACCRKTGQHKCGMPMQDKAPNADRGLVSTASQCPCSTGSASTLHFDGFAPSTAEAVYAGLVAHTRRNTAE